MMTLSMSTPMKRAAISKMPSDSSGMKTNMTFLSWAGGRPWIVSSTPCTQAQVQHTATAGQRKVSMRVEKESGREKREEMKTNMTFLSWAGGRTWIVSSTPCTQAQVQQQQGRGKRRKYTELYLYE